MMRFAPKVQTFHAYILVVEAGSFGMPFGFKGTFELAFLGSGRMQKATSTHSDTTYFRSRILITA